MYKKKYGTKKRPARRGGRKPSAKPSKSFAKKVNAIIHKNVESKEVSFNLVNTDFNGPVNNVADVIRVIPTITQGTDGGNRIGDQVLGQRLSIRGHMMINIVPNTTGVTIPSAIPSNCRMMIRAFCCSVKKFSNYDDVSATTTWMSKFLKNGNTLQGLDGTVRSMYLPVNTDVITVHKEIKKYVTIPAIFAQTATAAGFSNTAVGFESSCKFFNFSMPIKKLLKYDDTSFSPQNDGRFFVISYAKLDDTAPDILVARITANFVSTLRFEDA